MFVLAEGDQAEMDALRSTESVPPITPKLLGQMEAELIAAFRQEDFQHRLRAAWKRGTHNASKREASRDLRLEVQIPVAARFGFEPSQKGVLRAAIAARNVERTPELWSSYDALEWLLDPDLQRKCEVHSPEDLKGRGSWWVVVGGEATGGLLVRKGQELGSTALRSRLVTGARLKAVEAVAGARLHYDLVSGDGPDCGWVSIEAAGKELVVPDVRGYVQEEMPRRWGPAVHSIPPRKPSPGARPALMDKAPAWASASAEKLRARRARSAVQPPEVEKPSRLRGEHALLRLPPHVALSRKQMEEMAPQNKPGFWSGAPFPHTPEQITDFGPDWLTQAFHSFGTLAPDNRIVEILRVQRLPSTGVDQAGGAAVKAFVTVRYEKADPSLHHELFAKMPYEMSPDSPPTVKDARHRISAVYGDADGSELCTYAFCEHLFPFRVPRLYFCDISRETTNYILITERVHYAQQPQVKDGKVLARTPCRAWQVLPACQKKQDYLLEDPPAIYGCCMRAMGQLAGWDHLGRFDEYLGPLPKYTATEYLANAGPRKTLPDKRREGLRSVARGYLDQGIRFATQIAPALFSNRTTDFALLESMKDDIVDMAPHFADVQLFMGNSSDYVAAMHPNLQPDNAYFWRDEQGELDCGVLDWCNFGRLPFVSCFLGCLVGMDADMLDEHEEGMVRTFVEEYRRYGGPTLDCQDVLLRLRLTFLRMLMDSCQWVEKEILPDMPAEAWEGIKDKFDERFVGCWSARCRGSNIINSFEFWHRRNFTEIFEEWKAGVGKPYLTTFA